MGLGPPKGMKSALGPATTFHVIATLSFVIPTGAKRSGGTCGSADLSWKCLSTERTRISYYAELTTSTYAPFRKERRMRIANANKFDRKSGGAEWSDLRFLKREP
jgi:hypothetical protein